MRSLAFLLIVGFVLVMAGKADAEDDEVLESIIPLHFNLKEGTEFSPETRSDIEPIEEKHSSFEEEFLFVRNKGEFKSMGIWESNPVNYDVTITDVMFNLWWVEDPDDEDYDADLELRWTVFLNGEQIFQFTDEEGYMCEETRDEPCEYAEAPTNVFPETVVQSGQNISLEVEMKSFQSIYIYYDNASRDSGMMVMTDGVKFEKSFLFDKTVGFEFIEPWETKIEQAIEDNFLTIIVDDIELDNSQQKNGYPQIGNGNVYTLNGTEITSVRIIWFIEDEYVKLDQSVISFSYARKTSTTTPPTLLSIKELPGVHLEQRAAIIDFISSDEGYGLVNLTENYDNTTTITTYLEGKKTGYTSNGNYGDVITFYKNGLTTYEGNRIIPTTSRVMAWVEVIDKENGTYYIPEIDTYFYGKIELSEIGLPPDAPLTGLTQSGYLTKVDSISSNPHPDQLTHYDHTGNRAQPVQPEWIIGIKTQQFDCRMETGSNVIFEGHGLSSSTITDYLWESSIDGELSTNASFNTNSLSMGKHTISFTVRDDSGLWSSPAYASLMIVYPKAEDDDDDSGPTVPSISLISSIAAVSVIALRRRY